MKNYLEPYLTTMLKQQKNKTLKKIIEKYGVAIAYSPMSGLNYFFELKDSELVIVHIIGPGDEYTISYFSGSTLKELEISAFVG